MPARKLTPRACTAGRALLASISQTARTAILTPLWTSIGWRLILSRFLIRISLAILGCWWATRSWAVLPVYGTARRGGTIFIFRTSLFKIFICGRLWPGVNNRRGLLCKGFLGRCERYTRLWFYFQGAAEFVDPDGFSWEADA